MCRIRNRYSGSLLEEVVTMRNPAVSVSREIAMLRRSLKAVDRSLRRLAPKLGPAGNGRANGKAGRPARKSRLSPKRRAQLKLQGQYIGYIRQLKPRQKKELKRLFKKNGMEAAIRQARRLVSH